MPLVIAILLIIVLLMMTKIIVLVKVGFWSLLLLIGGIIFGVYVLDWLFFSNKGSGTSNDSGN